MMNPLAVFKMAQGVESLDGIRSLLAKLGIETVVEPVERVDGEQVSRGFGEMAEKGFKLQTVQLRGQGIELAAVVAVKIIPKKS